MKLFIDQTSESTFEEKTETIRRLFVVYDGRTGKVVHVHESVGDAKFVEDSEHHADMALKMVSDHSAVQHLKVLHVPANVHVQGGVSFHVDVKSGELKVDKADLSLKDFVTGIPKANVKKKPTVRKVAKKKSAVPKTAKKKSRR